MARRLRWPLVFAAAAVLAVPLLAVQTHDLSAFTVGVLRRDALVIPFATYTGKKWRADWPEPQHDFDVPVDVRSVPKGWWGPIGPRESWQAWLADGPPRLLRVLQPDWFEAHCLRLIGLRTDYRPAVPPAPLSVRPYPKDGLVVSPPHPVQRVEILDADDPERASLGPAVTETFNQIERTLHPHPVSRDDREKLTPKIEAVYAAGDDPRVLYVEAAREYHKHGDPAADCESVAFGGGWFVRRRDREYAPLNPYVTVINCDRDFASYMFPLGVVRAAERTFWLAQFSGWDGEQYEVIEIKPKAVERLVSRSGGGCQ